MFRQILGCEPARKQSQRQSPAFHVGQKQTPYRVPHHLNTKDSSVNDQVTPEVEVEVKDNLEAEVVNANVISYQNKDESSEEVV
jgi:recombination DNA repair RAD52 pathway protein